MEKITAGSYVRLSISTQKTRGYVVQDLGYNDFSVIWDEHVYDKIPEEFNSDEKYPVDLSIHNQMSLCLDEDQSTPIRWYLLPDNLDEGKVVFTA